MKRVIFTSLAVVAVGAMLVGCQPRRAPEPEQPRLFAVAEEITPRPELQSVPGPRETAFVAQMSGPGGFHYNLSRGQRFYLVDLETDRLLYTNIAPRGGRIQVGEGGAALNDERIWDRDLGGTMRIGLFVARRPEMR